jgi:hypothetical protein
VKYQLAAKDGFKIECPSTLKSQVIQACNIPAVYQNTFVCSALVYFGYVAVSFAPDGVDENCAAGVIASLGGSVPTY